ncbi:unnamed protein product [Eruca vesicaria subsp. sativa]|uniref:RPW8 domain-containing protein n=1 Tax=Eruca vesicaria subsp. sativa TaxID=29727 RepID=A0ABC8KSP2_ERUVS|nr:unnamed protein product [Eruca vesicaria subsp. sativa]
MNNVVSVGVGSVTGAVVSELLKAIIEEAKMVLSFKSVYMELASTMEKMLPIIMEIEMLQRAEELQDLENIIDEARVLVQKCSQVKRWNLPSKVKYTRKIEGINKKMLTFCQIQLQLIMLRNQRLIMHQLGFRFCSASSSVLSPDLSEILPVDTTVAIHIYLESIYKELDVLNVSPPVYRDICSVPKIHKLLFGLDLPLMEVKKKLLDDDDDDPVVSLVVSAPPGCGKTTLVTQLCHDDDIKEKFEYIFFCDVSSAPTFRTIVQNLLQHNGYEAPTYENDSQAVDGLRKLLEELKEEGPILLVLDDVPQGAESFLQKFQMNILNFKILVTSRYEFPSFGSTYHLKPLGDEDARSLLIERATLGHYKTLDSFEDPLQKTLKRCYGIPLLIEVIGVQLISKFVNWARHEVESWSEEETVLDSPQPTVLECLQPILNVLEPHLKDCFLDIGSFLTQGKIRVSIIVDIWMELYGEGSSIDHVECLNDLAIHNLLKLDTLWTNEHENIFFDCHHGPLVADNPLKRIPLAYDYKDSFYNNFVVTQHSILRELAICQSKSEKHHERKRLNLEIREDTFPDWCLDLGQPISACLLSISTDDLFSSTWVEMDCPSVEALVLNVSSSSYALPNFIATMKKLKVVVIINHGLGPAKLTNLSCLSSLTNLKRIRFEKISINLLDILLSRLGSLKKLSLFMCSLSEVSYNIEEKAIPEVLPSLQEIDINYCYDLYELPDCVSEVVSLKKLSITNCGKLSLLPKDIGNLSNLEVLRLSSCINLCELPETTDRLCDLRFLDMSDCLALKKLPSEIGKLQKLEKISMRMCLGCELPNSVRNLENLEVECDEKTGLLWERMKPEMRNLKIFRGI